MSGSSSTSKKAKSEYIPENVLFGRLLLKSGPELVGRLVTKPKFLTLTGYERLRSRNQENFVICPILIDIILMGIRLGAGEETANEIKVALQHTAIDRPELKRTAKALIHVLREEDRSLYQFYSIQKMFVRSGHTIKRNFKILSEGAFYLDIEALNFRDVANAENKINRYVNNRTLSAVEGIVPSGLLSSECKIVIASSAYYWAEWDAEINRAYTNIQTFMCRPNYAVQVEFMHSVASYGYLDCEPLGVRFLQMHLKNKQGALIIALPRNTFGLARLEENIEAVLNVSDKDFKDRRMRIAMPKFVISTTQDWKELLMELGITKLFTEGQAEISDIAGEPFDLHVNHLLQKTVIRVIEDGIETTTVYFPQKMRPIPYVVAEDALDFIVDHPFMFFIKIRKVIVYIGRLVDPSRADEVY